MVGSEFIFYGYEPEVDRGDGIDNYQCENCSYSNFSSSNCSSCPCNTDRIRDYNKKFVY